MFSTSFSVFHLSLYLFNINNFVGWVDESKHLSQDLSTFSNIDTSQSRHQRKYKNVHLHSLSVLIVGFELVFADKVVYWIYRRIKNNTDSTQFNSSTLTRLKQIKWFIKIKQITRNTLTRYFSKALNANLQQVFIRKDDFSLLVLLLTFLLLISNSIKFHAFRSKRIFMY